MKLILMSLFLVGLNLEMYAQTQNTSPLPAGETKIGGHLFAGSTNEVWTSANDLYFNYQGNAKATHFWSLGGNAGKSILSMLNNGNVGIGTTNPQDILHVYKDSHTGAIRVGGLNGLNNGRVYIQADLINDKSYIDVFGDNVYKKLFIDASSLILNSNSEGNIGIGTANPTEKLSVKGKIRSQEIKVESSNWPDYVFLEGYQLRSLKETEYHIKEKGHLPGIPSAKEVTAEGVDLGEMNAKLLEKIEELTLHLIEQNKRIEKLENQLTNK